MRKSTDQGKAWPPNRPGALLSVIGRIFHFFVMASETPWECATFGCEFTLMELKNATSHSPKTLSFEIYALNSAGDQTVSTQTQLVKNAFCILIMP